jgi:hypothetical protein
MQNKAKDGQLPFGPGKAPKAVVLPIKGEIEIFYAHEDCIAVKVDGKEYGGLETLKRAADFAALTLYQNILKKI